MAFIKRLSLFAIFGLVVAACSPSDVSLGTTTTLETSTTTTAPTTTTTVPPTTTAPPPATTTTTAATTTTTTLATTTTTELVPLTVELTDEGIQAGPTWLPFGTDDDDTVAALTNALGPPKEDSGWLDSLSEGWEQFGVCPQPQVRGVSWGEGGDVALQVLFTDGDTDFWVGGVEHFFAFYYDGSTEPTGLTTPEGIGVGSSLGDLKAVYDPADIVIEEAFFDPAVGYWAYDVNTWTGLWGFATGQSDAHVITSVNGGQGCGE